MELEKLLNENLRSFFSNNKKEKVIFIGAGFSRNLGLPSWEEFGNIHLDFLRDNDERINFEIAELLKKDDFRIVMSMTKEIIFNREDLKPILFEKYNNIFRIEGSTKEKKVKAPDSIFRKVYNLGLINVTTNYDDILDILANDKEQEFSNVNTEANKEYRQKVFHSKQDFIKVMEEKNMNFGDVYHIHGSINEVDNMIVSNEDYIQRYWCGNNVYKDFLELIFRKYDVIFLGYGLKELEILNYLFEKKKGPVKKTINERLFIFDCFDHEFGKIKLLEQYYLDNYSIKLCPYSKSEKGFNALVDVVDKISQVKYEEDSKNEKRILGINLLEKENLNSSEINDLLHNIEEYPDLQSAFFSKIHGKIGYLEYINNNRYFNSKNTDVLSLIKYLNSIYKKEKINSKYVNNIYKLANKNLNKYWLEYDFIMFLFKYNSNLHDFNLQKLLENDIGGDFKLRLVDYFVREQNFEIIFEFLEKNYSILLKLISKTILKHKLLMYCLGKNEIILKELMKYNDMEFVCNFIANYEEMYIKTNYENSEVKLDVINDILSIKSKNSSFDDMEIRSDSLKNIYQHIENSNINEKNELKKAISALFNESSYSSVFDKKYSFNNEKEDFLEKILMLSEEKNKIIEILFISKAYYLKKLGLYFIVKNKMVNFIVNKINNEDFDLQYIIRNSEFSGELKEIFKLVNNTSQITKKGEEFLLKSIQEGEFITYEERKEENITRWQYKRLRELQNLDLLKLEFNKLKVNITNDYKLSALIGPCEGGIVKMISKVNEKEAIKYDVYTWVEWMNNYKTEYHKEFLVEYDIREDIKVFISSLKNNLASYMSDFKYLINIKDYQWIYYILLYINEDIKVEKNIFTKYYKYIIEFIESYLEKLDDIYVEPDRHSVSKKHLIRKICEVLTNILRKKEFKVCEVKTVYKKMIRNLEELISDKNDFNEIFVGGNDLYTSFINSVHKDILELEFIFILKLSKLDSSEKNKEYIKNLILNRAERGEKEFYIFFGNYLSDFKMLDELLTEEFISNMNDENKEMFLSGFSYSNIINQELYDLVKPIFMYIKDNEYKDKKVISRILSYYTLAYLLEYKNADIEILKVKEILSRSAIFNIFSLKKNYMKLVEKYDEKVFATKMKKIWGTILGLDWKKKDKEIIKSTIQIVENFDFIDTEISQNIIDINNFIEFDGGFNYKLCEYLIRIVSLENVDIVIECINEYKPEEWDEDIIELCKEIENISYQKMNKFKDRWLCKNTKKSKLRDYFLNMQND